MQKRKNQNLKIATINGKSQSLEESHIKAGVGSYCCSDFLASTNLLAEGEYLNDFSRNAMVVITDLQTGELKGYRSLLCEKHFT